MSRNAPASLPSRNATSGSTLVADDASVFAFFAIRCDSTASWFANSSSRQLPPRCADLLRRLLRQLERARRCPG